MVEGLVASFGVGIFLAVPYFNQLLIRHIGQVADALPQPGGNNSQKVVLGPNIKAVQLSQQLDPSILGPRTTLLMALKLSYLVLYAPLLLPGVQSGVALWPPSSVDNLSNLGLLY